MKPRTGFFNLAKPGSIVCYHPRAKVRASGYSLYTCYERFRKFGIIVSIKRRSRSTRRNPCTTYFKITMLTSEGELMVETASDSTLNHWTLLV